MSTVVEALLTAEEFRALPDDGRRLELERGRIVEMTLPTPRHGYVRGNVVGILRAHVKATDLGRVVSNDSGIVTERSPDTVRGGDVAFYSYQRLPKGPFPPGYLDVMPELVFEVLSPSDRWKDVLAKVTEYVKADVAVVCVLDPERETLYVYSADQPPRVLTAEQEWTLPEILGELKVPVRAFFE